MNDLISRQAAIDAIKKCRNESDMPDMWYDGMSCALRCIYQLPSAQPECAKDFVMLKVIDLNGRPYYSIIYLENGNEFEGYSSYDLKVISEYLKRYFGFAQPERQKGEWIAVTEDGDVYKRICSCCGREAFFQNDDPDELYDGGRYELSDFCPHCGADMREVSE